MYTYSILHSKTEVHGIITAGAIDTLKVPDPSEQQQTQGTLTLPRGSIDISKGEGDNTGATLISLLSKLSLNFHINFKPRNITTLLSFICYVFCRSTWNSNSCI